MNCIGLIPARSGSKGISHKNIKFVAGKSLIQHAAEAAYSSKLINSAYISTDSFLYEQLGKKYGLMSLGLRSSKLSNDTAKSADVINDFVRSLNIGIQNNWVVLLQPTSPVRSGEFIDECIQQAIDTGETVVSVSKIEEPHPFKTLIERNGCLEPMVDVEQLSQPRQGLPDAFQISGAVYVIPFESAIELKIFTKSPVFIPQERFVNIDCYDDLKLARNLIRKLV